MSFFFTIKQTNNAQIIPRSPHGREFVHGSELPWIQMDGKNDLPKYNQLTGS